MDYTRIQHCQIITADDNFKKAAIELIQQARHTIRIRSALLDPTLFDNDAVRDALSTFVRSSRYAELRILIDRPDIILQRGHRLLTLMRKLSDKISFRQYHDEPNELRDSYMITDVQGILIKPVEADAIGYFSLTDKVQSGQMVQSFDNDWFLSPMARQLRELHL